LKGQKLTKGLLLTLLVSFVPLAASASPFPPFNKPMSINWWQYSCQQRSDNKYAEGYCAGVIYSHLNQLEEWCVPEDVTWGEVTEFLAAGISEATLKKPISQLDVGVWTANALKVKWPCEERVTQGLVTDPDLIKRLDALREKNK